LACCYRAAGQLAVENGIRTIAFPAISCGVYGYPLAEAAGIAIREVAAWLRDNSQIEQVVFVLFDQRAYDAYQGAYQQLLDSEQS